MRKTRDIVRHGFLIVLWKERQQLSSSRAFTTNERALEILQGSVAPFTGNGIREKKRENGISI